MSRSQYSKWESGVGLIEVMIATAVVGALALFSGYYAKTVLMVARPTVENRFSCTTQAATMLSKIRGQAGSLYSPNTFYPQTNGGFTPPTGVAAPFQYTTLVPELWAGIPTIMANTTTPTTANALMLSGPMRALNMLYMGTYPAPVDFCTGFNSSPLLVTLSTDSLNILSTTTNISNLATTMQIQLYNLATGVIQPCTTKAWIHPQGFYLDSQNINGFATAPGLPAPAPYFKEPANYTDQYGILLQVQTTYNEYNPQTNTTTAQSCVAAQQLSYDRDFTPPPAPSITVATTDPGDGGDANSHTAALTLTEISTEPGLVMVCRDRSTIQLPGSYACYYSGPSTAGPGPQFSTVVDLRPVANAPPNTEDQSTVPGTIKNPTPTWIPCEQLTLCGKSANAVPTIVSTGSSISMTANYSNLPSDCVVRIEAAAMDAAGNLNSGSVYYAPAQSVTSTTYPISKSTIPRPTCGNFCGVPGNGYWQTGACCVVPIPATIGCGPGIVGAPGGAHLNLSPNP